MGAQVALPVCLSPSDTNSVCTRKKTQKHQTALYKLRFKQNSGTNVSSDDITKLMPQFEQIVILNCDELSCA